MLVACSDMLHWHAGHLVKSLRWNVLWQVHRLGNSVSWTLQGFLETHGEVVEPSKALPLRRKMVDTPFKHGAPEGFRHPSGEMEDVFLLAVGWFVVITLCSGNSDCTYESMLWCMLLWQYYHGMEIVTIVIGMRMRRRRRMQKMQTFLAWCFHCYTEG